MRVIYLQGRKNMKIQPNLPARRELLRQEVNLTHIRGGVLAVRAPRRQEARALSLPGSSGDSEGKIQTNTARCQASLLTIPTPLHSTFPLPVARFSNDDIR